MESEEHQIRKKFEALSPVMSERMRRLWAGAEAESLGPGGIVVVMRATGMSRTTIRAGRDELRAGVSSDDVVEVRRPGAGRPSLVEKNPELVEALESLVDLMIETMIAESVLPIAATGFFGHHHGADFLQMIRRKAEWLKENRENLTRLIRD